MARVFASLIALSALIATAHAKPEPIDIYPGQIPVPHPSLPISEPPAPPLPSNPMSRYTALGAQSVAATDLWKKGEAAAVAAAFGKANFSFKVKKPLAFDEKLFLNDWIVALSYADPAAAAAKLDEWDAHEPAEPVSIESAIRLTLRTRILLRQGQVEQAKAGVSVAREAQRALVALLDTKQQASKKIRLSNRDYERFAEAGRVGRALRSAEFLIATHDRGEAAFADFSASAFNPFWNDVTSVTINGSDHISCTSNNLRADDWMMAEIVYLAADKSVRALPFAQSRDAAIKPFLESLPEWDMTFRRMGHDAARHMILARCAQSPPPATDLRADYEYLSNALKARTAETGTAYEFNVYSQPIGTLVRDKQWSLLLLYASRPINDAPYAAGQAQRALLDWFSNEEKPDQTIVDTLKFMMLPGAAAGDARGVRANLPLYLAFMEGARKNPKLPPRLLSFMELEVARLHEIVAEPALAETLYRRIAVRAPTLLPEKTPEIIKAQLRLAALADAAGKRQEADSIFENLGLSPQQCSLYQPKPPIVAFKSPDYPSAALRNEIEGNVRFEFDLGKDGSATNFRVTASSPPFLFDIPTIASFKKAKFAPATRGGEALPCEAARQSFLWRIPEY